LPVAFVDSQALEQRWAACRYSGVPVRAGRAIHSLPSFRGQRNNIGWWWFAATRCHIGFEPGWSATTKASGLDVALKTLASQPYGPVLLLLLAAGIAAFGVFALLDARFRKI
jgi:hypothetical protein